MRGLFFCLINFVVFLSSDFLIKTEPCQKRRQDSIIDCIRRLHKIGDSQQLFLIGLSIACQEISDNSYGFRQRLAREVVREWGGAFGCKAKVKEH